MPPKHQPRIETVWDKSLQTEWTMIIYLASISKRTVGAGGREPSSTACHLCQSGLKLPTEKLPAPQPFCFSCLPDVWRNSNNVTHVFIPCKPYCLSTCSIRVIFRESKPNRQHWGTEQLLALICWSDTWISHRQRQMPFQCIHPWYLRTQKDTTTI